MGGKSKRCSRCGVEFPEPRSNGYCSPCRREIRSERNLFVFDQFFSSGCVDCGEMDRDVLEAHHIKPKGRPLAYLRYNGTINMIEEELAKCVPLCANCHKRRHARMKHVIQAT